MTVPHFNIDLHTHTTSSDGTLTPDALVLRAKHKGVTHLAITDHDDTAGLALARQTAKSVGIHLISGVEISVTFCGKTIHIVGLGINENNLILKQGLAYLRSGRDSRATKIDQSFRYYGIEGALAGARQFANNPELVSRTHFARFLVQQHYCNTQHDVFKHYLIEGKPGFVDHEWATLSEALSWIHDAGGVAVIAHGGRYKFSPVQRFALFSEFKALGGQGIEVLTGSHTISQYAEYADIAVEFDLAASKGSDFHSPNESRLDLGELPDLPSRCTPLWERYPQLLTY